MTFLDWLRSKQRQYSGGSGETMEEAVIVTAPNTSLGVSAEYRYVSRRFGRKSVDWTLVSQALIDRTEDGRRYDLLTVRLKSGEVKDLYFDITAFFGKF